MQTLPKNCLNLVFIDPTDCSVPFYVIEELKANLNRFDLILNIAIGTDVIRNIRLAVLNPRYQKVRNKYIKFLGSSDYFDNALVKRYAQQNNSIELKRAFIAAYESNLKKLGLGYTDVVKVKHYYYLLFASGNPIGINFWKKANRIDPTRQRTFVFTQ